MSYGKQELVNEFVKLTGYDANKHTGPIICIFSQMLDLWLGEDRDDYGPLKPTPFAIASAGSILLGAYSLLKNSGIEMPNAHVVPDGGGGIRVEWSNNERKVRLLVYHESQSISAIYWRSSDDYSTVRAEPESLARYLKTLIVDQTKEEDEYDAESESRGVIALAHRRPEVDIKLAEELLQLKEQNKQLREMLKKSIAVIETHSAILGPSHGLTELHRLLCETLASTGEKQ